MASGITQIGSTSIQPLHPASCHCGAVRLALRLPQGIQNPRRCDCSICRRKGAIVISVPLADLTLLQGQEALSCYQFNTHTAKHYFCRHCGIYTHHQRRSNPHEYGVNLGCLEGVNPYLLGPVEVTDGIHHPSDRQESD
ncbi:GFA family protein [Balneatrix alpica]|uniref:GFA family protein n=1 Tax=Balneatrix alpica TaxID=75684 RepID=A0ABV5ZHI4_9GAMM|nr:GFA family protein [Balneatrix alpica]